MKYASFKSFSVLCESLEVPGLVIREAYEGLLGRYTETHRYYHNLAHIEHMLSLLAGCTSSTKELELAIWYHDAIYDPQKKDNEQQSRVHFLNQLGAYVSCDIRNAVGDLIMATEPMSERVLTSAGQLISDIDLSILGMPTAEYRAYSVAVRMEYSYYPLAEYREGRSKVLESILSKKIFYSEGFQHLEEPARDNISHELRELA